MSLWDLYWIWKLLGVMCGVLAAVWLVIAYIVLVCWEDRDISDW